MEEFMWMYMYINGCGCKVSHTLLFQKWLHIRCNQVHFHSDKASLSIMKEFPSLSKAPESDYWSQGRFLASF